MKKRVNEAKEQADQWVENKVSDLEVKISQRRQEDNAKFNEAEMKVKHARENLESKKEGCNNL